jgi:hypothetical protein
MKKKSYAHIQQGAKKRAADLVQVCRFYSTKQKLLSLTSINSDNPYTSHEFMAYLSSKSFKRGGF